MVALPLFDVVLSFNQSPARSAAVADELAKSALDDIHHIENLDEGLAPSDPSITGRGIPIEEVRRELRVGTH